MKNTVFWIGKSIRHRLPAMAVMTAAHMGNSLLGVCFALGARGVIDAAVSGDSEVFRRACMIQGAVILGLLFCQAVHRHLHDRLVAELDRDWKRSLLRGLLHSDYAAVSRYHSGELLNRLNNDVRILSAGLVDAIPNLAALCTRLVAALVVLTALEPWFSVLICSAGVVVIAATGLLRRNMKKLHKQVSEQEGRVSGFFQEVLEKLLMVQTMDAATEMERRADGLMADRYVLQRKRKNVSLAANTCVGLMSHGASFVALLWCATKLLRDALSFGSLTAVISLTELALEAEPMDRSSADVYSRLRSVCADGLSFTYDRDRVLEDVSVELPKGAFAVITGPSGIGKSTLLKLLLGVFRPDSGHLYLNLGDEKIAVDRSTRRLFAYVPQGNLLLSGTLRENLTIARPDASEEELCAAMYVSAVEEFLPQLPKGLDTVLGESGAGLSEGQAQRVAIARAVLGGAPILLLDECTSALDEQTERLVLSRIRQLRDRTCIAVTHRTAALELCDCQWKMHDGKLTVQPCD